MTSSPRNIAGSVRQRLLNIARAAKEEFQFVLTRYAVERLLFRLSQSPHGNRFVLKGAMLFQVWTGAIHRPTKDLDLLGYGENSPELMAGIFQDVCRVVVIDDGLKFIAQTVTAELIKDGDEYEGVRVHFNASLDNARIPLQVDIGFGDAITPAAVEAEFPTLLEFPAPRVMVYPKATVIAEKFQAMVALGIANSRMKDFFDLWTLAREFEFDGSLLARAIAATFERRRTAIPQAVPMALTAEFATDRTKATQWRAFLNRSKLAPQNSDFGEVIELLRAFLMPPTEAFASGSDFTAHWPPAGPWQSVPQS